jgi:hypothetical protein
MRRRYQELFKERRAVLERLSRMPGIRMVDCATNAEPRSVLMEHFRHR